MAKARYIKCKKQVEVKDFQYIAMKNGIKAISGIMYMLLNKGF